MQALCGFGKWHITPKQTQNQPLKKETMTAQQAAYFQESEGYAIACGWATIQTSSK